jgi:hypothetical protein
VFSIGEGIHQYGKAHDCLPPAYQAAGDGKPLLSWRVLILPHVEHGSELFRQFHLDEPWDGEHNKALIAKMPPIYADPSGNLVAEGKTHYLAVCGEDTMFPTPAEGKGLPWRNHMQEFSKTILVVEAADERAVVWTKPDDFHYRGDDPLKGLLGRWPDCFFVVMANGQVRVMPPSITPDLLQPFCTLAGGED